MNLTELIVFVIYFVFMVGIGIYFFAKSKGNDEKDYFLGGRQPLCVIESDKAPDGPKVLVIRDSYSDSLAPFLTERFSEVHLFDPRNNLTSVKDYVAQNGIDSVIVLYSFQNFATDQNLFVLGR